MPDSADAYSFQELQALQERGVQLHAAEQLWIRRDVPLDQIASGSELFPGARLQGSATRIHPNAKVGLRGPVHVEDSQVGSDSQVGTLGPVSLVRTTVGPRSVLGSGAAEDAVFLGKETSVNDFTTGLGFRVRKGSLYEEDSSSAQHTDTKMTILMPWSTLGSNINFCDALLSGGRGPQLGEFSEVGSGTIHFNFTTRGDKATGSCFGDVIRGVLLEQERIFIGGNCSLMGPMSADFGVIIGAGSRLGGVLGTGLHLRGLEANGLPGGLPARMSLRKAKQVLGSQLRLLKELLLLEVWYRKIRVQVLARSEEQTQAYEQGARMVCLNRRERLDKLQDWLLKACGDSAELRSLSEQAAHKLKRLPEAEQALEWELPETVLHELGQCAGTDSTTTYTEIVRAVAHAPGQHLKSWLQSLNGRLAPYFSEADLH